MKLIEEYIEQYNREFDFFQELSRITASMIEDQLVVRGIKAIVSHRAKRPDSLREKLIKRHQQKQYKSREELVSDIPDMAGVRVSLYFPSERTIVDELVCDTFDVDKKKVFPEDAHTPKYEKRFSGYWATHYRVRLRDEANSRRYVNSPVEVQVASVLMHAWAEVEHDLVYKPHSGDLSDVELSILDEINGLVLSGEIALERLQKAMSERTKAKKKFSDGYELTNYIINSLPKDDIKKLKLGKTQLLNFYMQTFHKTSPNHINQYIELIDNNHREPVSDQILNMFIYDDYDKQSIDMKKFFKGIGKSETIASGFEAFFRCWIVFEKSFNAVIEERLGKKQRPGLLMHSLNDSQVFTEEEIADLKQLRNLRNGVLHGAQAPCDEHLKDKCENLKKLTLKLLGKINEMSIKKAIQRELDKIQ